VLHRRLTNTCRSAWTCARQQSAPLVLLLVALRSEGALLCGRERTCSQSVSRSALHSGSSHSWRADCSCSASSGRHAVVTANRGRCEAALIINRYWVKMRCQRQAPAVLTPNLIAPSNSWISSEVCVHLPFGDTNTRTVYIACTHVVSTAVSRCLSVPSLSPVFLQRAKVCCHVSCLVTSLACSVRRTVTAVTGCYCDGDCTKCVMALVRPL